MSRFPTHTPDSAPADGRELLAATKKAYGFVPNLVATMVTAPATTKGYVTLGKIFDETSFTPTERQVVLLAASRANGCEYCVSAHTTIAGMQKVERSVVDAIREDRPIADPKLEALRRLVTRVHATRGWLEEADLAAFEAAGYGPQQVLEVVLGVAFKTISNYTNHLADTPLDDAFAGDRWQAPKASAA